jgi:hypothetical protein
VRLSTAAAKWAEKKKKKVERRSQRKEERGGAVLYRTVWQPPNKRSRAFSEAVDLRQKNI